MRAFFLSMTGRVFLTILLGGIASAALTQWVNMRERQRALEIERDLNALERSEHLVTTLDVVPFDLRDEFLSVANTLAIRLEPYETALPLAPARSEFGDSLSQRLGKEFDVRSLSERPAECDAPIRATELLGPTRWRGVCEVLRVRLRDGHDVLLKVLPPRPVPDQLRRKADSQAVIITLALSIGLLAYLVARMTSRSLKQLAQAATDLGKDINRPPLRLTGVTEIRQAAGAFNALQARIRQYIFQRTQMLAAITHDLQTPLTRMRLRLEKVDDRELRERLIDDLSAMQAMVREGLDLARSMDTSEGMQVLDLDSLLDSVCTDAADAGQQITLQGQSQLALMGRPMALRRCLNNILDNAIKYGGRADVTVERLPGAARIRVRDHGPGIAADELAHVFEPFYRVEGSRSRESGGTGLGLTIARNIAEQHGGSIAIGNHPDGGLEVQLVLPEYRGGR
ncbi:ATP-binding protein [Massilia sp. TS11]|uniref:ATP-binding protein n=1 Tax=Massilia sp. TS11 TaxID=2908003 RepID=UPI001EDBDC41|nr:ATP-binding protein [Massilia sp. TS11]MCG2584892.1 ATP-binding protein [Massilia sp. TS11]